MFEDDGELRREAERYVDEVWEDIVADIASLVAIESVEDLAHAREGAPFGPGPARALGQALDIAQRLGLETTNLDGYVGYGDLKGSSSTQIATICHADIVPIGPGWTYDPLSVTRREGYLIGRGVLDDKGPLALSLWAAHFFVRHVRETGEVLPYTLRCIVGSNEETGMADVDHYLECEAEPAFCFSPDASFPLICGEKGHFGATVTTEALDARDSAIVEFEAGHATNAIPGEATAVVAVAKDELVASEGLGFEDSGVDEWGRVCTRIRARGRAGHAMEPKGTVNAIALIVDCLIESGVDLGALEPFVRFQRLLLKDSAGGLLGIKTRDGKFGPLTIIGGTVRMVRKGDTFRITQSMDARYPTSVTGTFLHDRIAKLAKTLGLAVESHSSDPFYLEPNSPAVRACVRSYQEVFDSNLEPFTIGGGTYARRFSHAAAFGPVDPRVKDPEWAGPEHGADEAVSEAMLRKALVTYILAIGRIMRLDL